MPLALNSYFAWPTLPFTVLLCLASAYWVLVILGGIGLEVFDLDLDVSPDPGGDGSIFDWGVLGLRWFNLGEVPLMVWLTAFALLPVAVLIRLNNQGLDNYLLAGVIGAAAFIFAVIRLTNRAGPPPGAP